MCDSDLWCWISHRKVWRTRKIFLHISRFIRRVAPTLLRTVCSSHTNVGSQALFFLSLVAPSTMKSVDSSPTKEWGSTIHGLRLYLGATGYIGSMTLPGGVSSIVKSNLLTSVLLASVWPSFLPVLKRPSWAHRSSPSRMTSRGQTTVVG